jgi:hypothetical protein
MFCPAGVPNCISLPSQSKARLDTRSCRIACELSSSQPFAEDFSAA